MENIVRILHLSDIHFENSTFSNDILSQLLEKLEEINNETSINIICITGDLVHKGKGIYNSIIEALENYEKNFIMPIITKLNMDKTHLFFVPGNHDVDLSLDSEYVEAGIKSLLNNNQKVDEFVNNCLIGKHEGINRIIPFKEYEKNFYKGSIHENGCFLFCSTYTLNIFGITIGITCTDSTWRYYGSDTDMVIVESQINESLKKIENCDVKIFLSHYGTESLCEFQKNLIDDFITENFDIALFGHDHRSSVSSTIYLRGSLFVSKGKCNWARNTETKDIDYINGFSLIEYDIDNSRVLYFPYVYSKKSKKYVKDTFLAGDSGCGAFTLNKTGVRLNLLHRVASFIKGSFLQEVDHDMITYGTDTKAPSSLNELFVEPNLIYRKGEEPDDEENISIHNICSNKQNYAIIGSKETGKTVLLDELVNYFILNINELRTMPIHIKYESYKHSRFETAISIFTALQIKDVPNFLENEKIVLLIDNLKFSEKDMYKINELIELCNKYKNFSFIVTINTKNNENIPLEFVDSPLYQNCKILFLKYFKTKQIAELTKKWFLHDLDLGRKEKQEKIINLLISLKLPRTPLAISMFLWILEKQEEYLPINQSTMLENFIEKLFRKHSDKEEYYKEFDYRNKEKLLAFIANKMMEIDNENYSLKFSDAIDFCSAHLKKRRFDFDSEKIINQFIYIGLFVKYTENSDVYVRFRFNCFFQYFLMKNMDNDDFLKYVLQEENYLTFNEEISLFTGIKRDRDDILCMLVGRMKSLFLELYNDICKIPNGYDSFFEVISTFTEQLDRKFIDHIGNQKEDAKNEIEKLNDKMLETMKTDESVQRKDYNLSKFRKLEISWGLAASVLRNTEETEKNDLKLTAYRDILQASFCFVCLYKSLYIEYLKKKEYSLTKEEKENSKLIVQFLPLLHELTINDFLSSAKLSLVFKDYIESIIDDKKVTQLEKFVAVFLYADIHGKNCLAFIKRFIAQIKGKYIFDMTLFKLLTYYYMRADTKKKELEYENMIADLIVLAKKYPKNAKSKIIASYKKKRIEYLSENQGVLDL